VYVLREPGLPGQSRDLPETTYLVEKGNAQPPGGDERRQGGEMIGRRHHDLGPLFLQFRFDRVRSHRNVLSGGKAAARRLEQADVTYLVNLVFPAHLFRGEVRGDIEGEARPRDGDDIP